MTDKNAHVSVRILDKEYQVACPADERTDLLDSAEVLNEKMREIRDGGRIVGLDRIAVMAALNMANDLIHAQARDQALDGDFSDRLFPAATPCSSTGRNHEWLAQSRSSSVLADRIRRSRVSGACTGTLLADGDPQLGDHRVAH